MILSYDSRNTWLSKESIFLYDDSLLFIYKHRDTNHFILNPILFNTYKLDDTADITILNVDEKTLNGSIICTYDNRVVIKHKNETYSIIHLYFKELQLHMYQCDDYTQQVLTNNMVAEFDGYPIVCCFCNQKTSIAHANFQCSSMFLGNSFCQHCMIRYSKSDKTWICCQSIVSDNDGNYLHHKMCGNYIVDNKPCDRIHNTNYKLELKETYFPPYLSKGKVIYL